jgi:hypothetical protein
VSAKILKTWAEHLQHAQVMAKTDDRGGRSGHGQNGRLLANARRRLGRGNGQKLRRNLNHGQGGRCGQTNASSRPIFDPALHHQLIELLAPFGAQALQDAFCLQ